MNCPNCSKQMDGPSTIVGRPAPHDHWNCDSCGTELTIPERTSTVDLVVDVLEAGPTRVTDLLAQVDAEREDIFAAVRGLADTGTVKLTVDGWALA